MAEYLAMRISGGHLKYEDVVTKFPQFKDEIDIELDKKYGMSFK